MKKKITIVLEGELARLSSTGRLRRGHIIGEDASGFSYHFMPAPNASPLERNSTIGTLDFADEGAKWAYGWDGPDVKALRATQALLEASPA